MIRAFLFHVQPPDAATLIIAAVAIVALAMLVSLARGPRGSRR